MKTKKKYKYDHSQGYFVILEGNHPLADKYGRVYEHRLIMQDELFKCKNPKKMHVHHIDHNKQNNEKSNLMVVDCKTHIRLDKGWKLIEEKWYKKCPKCSDFLHVSEKNFYLRTNGKFFHICKSCARIVAINAKKRPQ